MNFLKGRFNGRRLCACSMHGCTGSSDGWRPRRPVWVWLLVVVAVVIIVPIVVSAVFYVLRPMGALTSRSWGITRSFIRSVGSSDS